MNLIALLKILILTTQFVEKLILEAAERKKAGNLLEIQAAISDLKSSTDEVAKDEAIKRIQAAFRSR